MLAYHIKLSLDTRAYFSDLEPTERLALTCARLSLLETLTPEDRQALLPRIVRVKARRLSEITSVVGQQGSGPFFFSPELRDMLEQLEPGVHEFHPTEVRRFPLDPQGGDPVLGTYYLLVTPVNVQAIVRERTHFSKGVGAFRESGGSLSANPKDPCVLRAGAIQGRHFWREVQKIPSPTEPDGNKVNIYFFCSDEFHDQFQARGFDGFDFIRKCLVEA